MFSLVSGFFYSAGYFLILIYLAMLGLAARGGTWVL